MPKETAHVDYGGCRPEACSDGACPAALECEYGSLVQPVTGEAPEMNPAKWCRGCARCVLACPFEAIRML